MTLRKIAIDNSVRFIPKSEQTKERDNKPITRKKIHFLVNKMKIFHRIRKFSLIIYRRQVLGNLQSSICIGVIIQYQTLFIFE